MLPRKVTVAGLFTAIFAVSTVYYGWLSERLPYNAGPDEYTHYDSVKFIYEHKRMARYPEDVAALRFTPYGTTRVFRPPLFYVSAAAVAGLFEPHLASGKFAFRKASVLFGGLTVALTFLAAFFYTGRISFGVLGAALTGLLPQFTFLSTYTNSDIAAICTASLVLVAMVLLLRFGDRASLLTLLGLALGLAFLSKLTAWIMFPAVTVFSILLFYKSPPQLARSIGIAFAVFTATVIWWLTFNVLNHGWTNLFNGALEQELKRSFGPELLDTVGGFRRYGVTFWQLLLDYDGFLIDSFKSTIGRLDWLKLDLGPPQYLFYAAVLGIALLVYGIKAWSRFTAPKTAGRRVERRKFVFETMLMAILLSQFLVYAWHNYDMDVQKQGRYLLVVNLSVVLLFVSSCVYATNRIGGLFGVKAQETAAFCLAAFGVLSALAIHAHAFSRYVAPFYDMEGYRIDVGEFNTVTAFAGMIAETRQATLSTSGEGGVRLVSTGLDPWIKLDGRFAGEASFPQLLRVRLSSDTASRLSVYWDEGHGFSEQSASHTHYPAGTSSAYVPIVADKPARFRLDPRVGEGEVVIHDLALADFSWQSPEFSQLRVGGEKTLKLGSEVTVVTADSTQHGARTDADSGIDKPWLEVGAQILEHLSNKWLMRLNLDAQTPGAVEMVWNDTSRPLSLTRRRSSFEAGNQDMFFVANGRICTSLRFYLSGDRHKVSVNAVTLSAIRSKPSTVRHPVPGWRD